jgi:alanine dehydrogenase
MLIGVPKEIKPDEGRVALTPAGADALVRRGHQVLVECGAGVKSGIADGAFAAAGARIAANAAEVWSNAAMIAAGMGARVSILDINLDRLRYLSEIMPRNVTPLFSNSWTIRDLLKTTHLLIGAVLVPGAKAPALVNREMLRGMMKGSVLVDVAVDQGGCVETCRPTTHSNPVFVEEGVIHYCVANMPGAVPQTSTYALTNATLPFAIKLAQRGLAVLKEDAPLATAANVINGRITCRGVAEAFGKECVALEAALR